MGKKTFGGMIKVDISKKLKFENSSELTIKHEFHSGEISGIYGRSGAGKTTLLKIIAGLVQPGRGVIEVNGQTWLDTERKINIPVQQRNIGFVFQDYALFPNMTVKQNLLYAAGKDADEKHIAHLLKITGLKSFVNVKPEALSGGQKQRTALARALVRKPSLLLLDEPLSATDAETRTELQQQLLQLQHEYQFTALLVSHDKNELRVLSNYIVHIYNGHIVRSGTATEVFRDNVTRINFTGIITEIEGGWMKVSTEKGVYKTQNTGGYIKGERVELSFDPDEAQVNKI